MISFQNPFTDNTLSSECAIKWLIKNLNTPKRFAAIPCEINVSVWMLIFRRIYGILATLPVRQYCSGIQCSCPLNTSAVVSEIVMSFHELRICLVFPSVLHQKTIQESSSALLFIAGTWYVKIREVHMSYGVANGQRHEHDLVIMLISGDNDEVLKPNSQTRRSARKSKRIFFKLERGAHIMSAICLLLLSQSLNTS